MNTTLTRQEREILELVLEGMKRREIAEKLWVTIDTVNKHLYHAYKKLGTNNRLDAAIQYHYIYNRFRQKK